MSKIMLTFVARKTNKNMLKPSEHFANRKSPYQLAKQANEILKKQGSVKRYYVVDYKYYRCDDCNDGDAFDELSYTEFYKATSKIIGD